MVVRSLWEIDMLDLMSSIKKASSEVGRIASDLVDKSTTEAMVTDFVHANRLEAVRRVESERRGGCQRD